MNKRPSEVDYPIGSIIWDPKARQPVPRSRRVKKPRFPTPADIAQWKIDSQRIAPDGTHTK